MAILITGLGYIGSALADSLLVSGKTVVGVENFFSTPREAVKPLKQHQRFTLIEGSVTDPATLARAFGHGQIEAVFHLAAQASAHPHAATPAYTEEVNFQGTLRVLEACAADRVPCVVVASSTRVYAPPLPRLLSERSPLRPPDIVHLSHLYAEALLELLSRQYSDWSPTLVALRLGTVHGTGPVMKTDPRFMAVPQRFCWQAARGEPLAVSTGPEALLAFVQVEDAVQAFVHSTTLPPGVHVANVAAEVRSVASLAKAVQQLAAARGLKVPIRFLGRARPYAERTVTSALDPTGFRPTRRLEDSLGAVLDYYLGRAGQQ